jgi:hypothetical protein
VLVTGSRNWLSESRLCWELDAIRADWSHMVVVHGGAKGADAMANDWARRNDVPVEVHKAQWSRWGKRAGLYRNVEMVVAGADVCLAFIRDGSRGATHCASVAAAAGVPLIIVRDDAPELFGKTRLLPEAYISTANVTESTVEGQ